MEDNERKQEVLHRLRRCGHYLHHMMGDGKASQFRVLNILSCQGTIPQSRLQEIMGIRQSSASELVQKLEEQNLIVRARSDDDRRQILISLTDAGREEQRAHEAIRSAHARELLAGLSDGELEQLYHILGKLLADWEEKRNPECRHPRPCGEEGSA